MESLSYDEVEEQRRMEEVYNERAQDEWEHMKHERARDHERWVEENGPSGHGPGRW